MSPAETKGLLLISHNLGVISGLFVDMVLRPKKKEREKKTVRQHYFDDDCSYYYYFFFLTQKCKISTAFSSNQPGWGGHLPVLTR